MEKNVAGKWIVFAYGLPDHTTPGVAITGDAANITANIRIDGGAANAVDDVNPTELEDGYYIFDITATESNGENILLTPVSGTANVQVIAVPGAVWTRPANFSELGIETDGDVTQVNTTVANTDMRGTDSAATATALATVDSNVDLILVDTGTTLDTKINDIQGATFSSGTDSLEAIRDRGDAAWVTGAGGSSPTVVQIRQEMDTNSTQLSDIVTDTAEIGVAGAGLTDLGGMSTGMKAEVNVEADTAITDAALATAVQVSGIANVGSATNTPAEADNVAGAFTAPSDTFTGVETSGTDASVTALDGTYHQIDDSVDAIDIVYRFDVGGDGVASSIDWTGYVSSANDTITVSAWDFTGTPAWVQVGEVSGQSGSTNTVESFRIFTSMTGTVAGTNLGKVYVRFHCAAQCNPTLYTDQLFTSFSTVSQTVGYALGRVWADTAEGTAGTESYVNGVADNPVDTVAQAVTIAGNLNIHDLHMTSDSTFAPTTDMNGYNVYGIGYTCTLGGHDYAGTHIFHASPMTGVATTTGGADHFDVIDSIVGNVTVDDAHFTRCSFNGTITLDQTTGGDLKLVDSRSIIAGSGTPSIDCGTAAVTHSISISNWHNGIEIKNLNNGGTNLFSISGTGQLVVASTCSGTMNVRGQWKITDNSGGNVTFVYDDIRTEVESILEDTGTTIPATIATVDGIVDLALADTNELQVAHAAGNLGVNVDKINGVTITGDGSATPFDV
jgi:hypothetical protein